MKPEEPVQERRRFVARPSAFSYAQVCSESDLPAYASVPAVYEEVILVYPSRCVVTFEVER
jgi:hypothetical protein